MNHKHTPGPWVYQPGSESLFPAVKLPSRLPHRQLVINEPTGEVSEVYEANARLIAAAPDLLAALKKAVRFGGLFPDLKAEAEAAIAKATGGR